MHIGPLPRLAPGTARLALPPLALALPALVVLPSLGLLLAALGAAVVVFHRDPSRSPPAADGVFLAPADGRVSVIREEGAGDGDGNENGNGSGNGRLRLGVYMSAANVHVNRAPAPGTVRAVDHRPGANRPAFSKDSERNERVAIDCGGYDLTLIAGAFARRIHPYVSAGDAIERGQRVGHISFGSRVDLLFPPEVDAEHLRVERGDRVRAGETIVAEHPPSAVVESPSEAADSFQWGGVENGDGDDIQGDGDDVDGGNTDGEDGDGGDSDADDET